MELHLSAIDVPIVYNSTFREYGIKVLNGGSITQLLAFCPWCGSKLPGSFRRAWIERLAEMNLEPGDAEIPEEMKSDVWWKKL